jgi:predicted transcriptional regulator
MEGAMTERLPENLVRSIDRTARLMNQSRADIIQKAVELYLADVERSLLTND